MEFASSASGEEMKNSEELFAWTGAVDQEIEKQLEWRRRGKHLWMFDSTARRDGTVHTFNPLAKVRMLIYINSVSFTGYGFVFVPNCLDIVVLARRLAMLIIRTPGPGGLPMVALNEPYPELPEEFLKE